MNLIDLRRNLAYRTTNPIVGILSKSGITPNTLTFINLALNIVAAYLIATGHFLLGGILVLVAGLFDLLVCGLLIWYIPQEGASLEIVLIFIVLIGSFLVSYIRARAEGLGWQCQVGLFTRAERVIVLAIGLLINQIFVVLCVLGVFVFITVVQRLVYLWKQGKLKGD